MRNDTWKRKWIASLLGGLSITAGVRAGDDKPPPYPSISPVLPAISANSTISPLPAATPPTPDVKPVAGEAPSIPTPAVPKIESPVVPKLETPVVPKIESPVVPKIESPVVPKLETPVVPKTDPVAVPNVPALPSVPDVKPQTKTPAPSVPPAIIPPAAVTPVVPPAATTTVPTVTELKPTTPTAPTTPPNIPPIVETKPSVPKAPPVAPPATEATTPAPMVPATTTQTPAASTTRPATEPVPPVTPATKPAAKATINVSIGATPGLLDNVGKLDAMLADSRESYMKIHDYSCHFIKQERIKGKLTPEVIYELHARTVPFAVYTKAVQPKESAGFETVYAAGRFATDQVRVKPSGGAYMTLAMDDSRTMSGRHPASQVGLGAVLGIIEKQIGMERKLGNPMTVTIGDFTYANKPVIRYEVLCDKPHANRYSHRTVIYFDKETKLPVRFEAYDEPRSGAGIGGDLLESYSFVNLKLNVGHSSAVFDR